jgi:hypothetical protein
MLNTYATAVPLKRFGCTSEVHASVFARQHSRGGTATTNARSSARTISITFSALHGRDCWWQTAKKRSMWAIASALLHHQCIRECDNRRLSHSVTTVVRHGGLCGSAIAKEFSPGFAVAFLYMSRKVLNPGSLWFMQRISYKPASGTFAMCSVGPLPAEHGVS